MFLYQIHIFEALGSPAEVTAEIQRDDIEAIRSARRLAQGRPFEVWNGLQCISGRATLEKH